MTVIMPCAGWAVGYGAFCLGRGAWRFAVAVHRIDFRLAAVPARVVTAGWVRGPVIEIADLRWGWLVVSRGSCQRGPF